MKQHKAHGTVIILYIVITLILTFPWVINFTTAIPGSDTWAYDESTFVWNIWRFKHNMLNLHQSPLHTTDIFFPLGIDLVLYTYNFLNALLGMPILLLGGLPLASNVTILFAYVMSGYGMYLLLCYLLSHTRPDRLLSHTRPDRLLSQTRPDRFLKTCQVFSANPIRLAAFIGGAVYAFSASRAIFSALGHYDIVSTEFIPFFTLFFLKSLHEPGLKNPILAGVFATLSLLAEMIFGVFLLFLGLILISARMMQNRQSLEQKSLRFHVKASFDIPNLFAKMIVLTLTTMILWSPVMVPILQAFRQGNFDLAGWGESIKLSADVVGWFTSTALHPLWGSDWVTRLRQVQEGTAPFSDVNTVFLGYGILLMAFIGMITFWRHAKTWVIVAIIFAIFTLGPLLQINGTYLFPMDNLLHEQGISQDVTFPMPFMLLHYIPIFRANRVPIRFAVVLSLALAVLVGYGVYWLFSRKPDMASKPIMSIPMTTLLMFILLFDQLALPLPLTSAIVPDVYYQIGAEPEDFTLLQLPLGWRNSFGVFGVERTQIQYYQHIHQKPMLGGNISRSPDFKFDYYRNIPLFQAFAQTELPTHDPPVTSDTLIKAQTQAGDLMTLYNIKYVVIHAPIPHRKPYEDNFFHTRQLAYDLLPLNSEPIYMANGVAVYQVHQPPIPDVLRIDFGDWTSDPYRGQGWSQSEFMDGASVNWAIDSQAKLFFPYEGDGDRNVTFHLKPFTYPNAPPQEIHLQLNGMSIGKYPLQPDWQIFRATMPVSALHKGTNRLVMQFKHQAIPRQVLSAQTEIGTTGVSVPVDIEVNSHADFAYITIGFATDAIDGSTHRRGFNVAVINPTTGMLHDKRGFDTATNHFEAEALTEFIAQIPHGMIVVISSKSNEANAFIEHGFESLGSSAGIPNVPYSLIGVKGADVGTAHEVSGEAYIRLGHVPDVRPLALAVDWMEITD